MSEEKKIIILLRPHSEPDSYGDRHKDGIIETILYEGDHLITNDSDDFLILEVRIVGKHDGKDEKFYKKWMNDLKIEIVK